jgi:hypothetical protein
METAHSSEMSLNIYQTTGDVTFQKTLIHITRWLYSSKVSIMKILMCCLLYFKLLCFVVYEYSRHVPKLSLFKRDLGWEHTKYYSHKLIIISLNLSMFLSDVERKIQWNRLSGDMCWTDWYCGPVLSHEHGSEAAVLCAGWECKGMWKVWLGCISNGLSSRVLRPRQNRLIKVFNLFMLEILWIRHA